MLHTRSKIYWVKRRHLDQGFPKSEVEIPGAVSLKGDDSMALVAVNQGRPQGIGGPRRGPRRSEFGGPKWNRKIKNKYEKIKLRTLLIGGPRRLPSLPTPKAGPELINNFSFLYKIWNIGLPFYNADTTKTEKCIGWLD